MAGTYTYQNALARVASYNPRATEDAVATFAVNDAIALLWNAYDFPFTKSALNSFWLNSYEQDYGAPLATIPTDLKGLRSATLVDTECDPMRHIILDVRRDLQLTGRVGPPEAMGYVPEKNVFRIHPRPAWGYGPGRFLVIGTYKKLPTLITRDTLATALPWNDEWFSTFCSALEWGLAPHSAANKMQLKQIALVQAAEMARATGLDESDPHGVAPAEPLVGYGRTLRLR